MVWSNQSLSPHAPCPPARETMHRWRRKLTTSQRQLYLAPRKASLLLPLLDSSNGQSTFPSTSTTYRTSHLWNTAKRMGCLVCHFQLEVSNLLMMEPPAQYWPNTVTARHCGGCAKGYSHGQSPQQGVLVYPARVADQGVCRPSTLQVEAE